MNNWQNFRIFDEGHSGMMLAKKKHEITTLYLHKNNDVAIKPMQSKWVFNLEIFSVYLTKGTQELCWQKHRKTTKLYLRNNNHVANKPHAIEVGI